MVDIPCEVLIDKPPASNVIPFPTKATCFFEGFEGRYAIWTNRGCWVEPLLTPRRPPIFAFFISDSPRIFIESPCSLAVFEATLAKAAGVRSPPGRLTRFRARLTPRDVVLARSTPLLIFRPLPTIDTVESFLGFVSDFSSIYS